MSEGKLLFTAVEDDKLVEMVSKFPCLYDASLTVYKDQSMKDNAWKEIAEFIERSVEDCKKRWRNIKDTYQKRQKKGKTIGSSASSKGKKWPLADMLTFLNKVDHKRESISNIEIDETYIETTLASPICCEDTTSQHVEDTFSQHVEDTSSEHVEDTPSFRRPSKRPRQAEEIMEFLESRRIEREAIVKKLTDKKGDDDVDLFFKSIAASVKKLRPDLINEAKMRSLQLIIELESRNSLT